MTEAPASAAVIHSGVGARPQQATPECLGLVDAGLMAGHSFRVGWAPGGRYAYPAGAPQILLPYMHVTALALTLCRAGLMLTFHHA